MNSLDRKLSIWHTGGSVLQKWGRDSIAYKPWIRTVSHIKLCYQFSHLTTRIGCITMIQMKIFFLHNYDINDIHKSFCNFALLYVKQDDLIKRCVTVLSCGQWCHKWFSTTMILNSFIILTKQGHFKEVFKTINAILTARNVSFQKIFATLLYFMCNRAVLQNLL